MCRGALSPLNLYFVFFCNMIEKRFKKEKWGGGVYIMKIKLNLNQFYLPGTCLDFTWLAIYSPVHNLSNYNYVISKAHL